MVTKNFTQFNKTNFEAEGVETCYIVVDYLNDMSGELFIATPTVKAD